MSFSLVLIQVLKFSLESEVPRSLQNDFQKTVLTCLATSFNDRTIAAINTRTIITDWWFGTFFIVPYIGNNHPNWVIFFRGVAQPPTRLSLSRESLMNQQFLVIFRRFLSSLRSLCGKASHTSSKRLVAWSAGLEQGERLLHRRVSCPIRRPPQQWWILESFSRGW